MEIKKIALKNTLLRKQNTFLFIIIVVFHVLFKIPYLDYSCFWYDETFGLNYSLQDWGLIKHTSEWDINPPLYYYVLWIWRHLFGISEFAIRFSSILFSSLAAGILFLFARKNFGKITAIGSLLFYTASNEIYFFSHEARIYSLVVFLALCSSWLYFSLYEKQNMVNVILLGIVNFFLIYGHYLSGLILAYQVILTLVFYQKDFFKRILYAFIITLMLCSWRFTKKTMLLILHHEKSFWLRTASFSDFTKTLYDFFNGPAIFYMTVLLIVSVIFTLIIQHGKFSYKKYDRLKMSYLLLMSTGTILITYFIGIYIPLFLKRYIVFSLPFIFILIGFLIEQVSGKIKFAIYAIILLIILFSFFKIDFKTDKGMNYRDAVAYIKPMKDNKTLILVENRDMQALFAYYYNKSIFLDFKNMRKDLVRENIYPLSNPSEYNTIDKSKFTKIILTQSYEKLNPDNDALLNRISNDYTLTGTNKNYEGLTIYFYAKSGS